MIRVWGNVLEFVLLIVGFILGLFIKDFFPKYFQEKAKNLATKEDIEVITDKIERVKHEYNGEIEKLRNNLNKDFEEYIDRMKFLKERSYKQYEKLYSKLYSIIIQSEYIRHFFNLERDFSEIPFIEIHKSNTKTVFKLTENSVTRSEEKITDPVTEFNKINLVERIIDKGELSSERLLKLAVAYRYVHQNYLIEDFPAEQGEKFKEEEVLLIGQIVKAVVEETNELKKICNLSYNENECSSGIMSWEQ